MRRRGLALILVVGVLAILAVLGSAFAVLSRLERKAASQRVWGTKAVLLARSGMEDALARISAGQEADYGGENWDGSADRRLSTYEAAQEVFRRTGVGTAADVETCPARHAMRPSYFARRPDGNPATVPVEGRERGYSGRLTEGTWALKVEDESGKINVNGGFLDALDRDGDGRPDFRDDDVASVPTPGLPAASAKGRGWNAQLARILNVLGQQPEVAVANLGTQTLLNRPLGGFRSLTQLQAALGTTRDLSPWITLSSWADRSVVHPQGYAISQATVWSLAELKRRRAPLALEEGGRSPVNLNAAPRPVLIALIQGLSATTFECPFVSAAVALPAGSDARIADAVLASRPFATWSVFEAFCDGLVPGAISGMSAGFDGTRGGNLAGADLLKANFNPNTRSSKELPDQILWKWVDKTDLITWSAEGSLHPTGSFMISAASRLMGGHGRLLAEGHLRTSTQAFSLARLTSQRDFLAGRLPDATPLSCLSLASASPPVPIPSQRTAGTGASWNTWGGTRGLAAMTYPCPPTAPPSPVDGWIALATVELPPANPSGGTLRFLLHASDGWDASVGGATGRVTGPAGMVPLGDPAQDVWPSPGIEPNALYPDGMHVQRFRAPAYPSRANLPPAGADGSNHGVLSYWVKPCLPGGRTELDVTCTRITPVDSQALAIGRNSPGEMWGIMLENKPMLTDVGYERQFRLWGVAPLKTGVILPGLRWRLVTAGFDTDETVLGRDVHLSVRGIVPNAGESPNGEWYPTPFHTSQSENLFQSDPVLVLGGYGTVAYEVDTNNHLIDEFAVVDFGDDAGLAATRSEDWARTERYPDGRYYKGRDAAFLSAPLSPSLGPVRLVRTWWTAHLPSESRRELRYSFSFNAPPPSTGVARDPDPALAGRCKVEVDLLEAAGTLDGPALRVLSQGGSISARALPAFRCRVRLGVDLADPLNQPILESPVLDDITFAWQGASGPRFTAWEQ